MKISFLRVLLLSLLGTPLASAAQETSPVSCPKAFQGFFVGANIGYGFGTASHSFTQSTGTPFMQRDTLSFTGIDGGLNAGYTHVFNNNIGIGLEFVANWSNSKGESNTTNRENGSLITRGSSPRLISALQLRGNLSYVICNFVAPKIILGWDNSLWKRELHASGTGAPGSPPFSFGAHASSRRNGFLWGAGVDFLVLTHWIIGFEYTGTIVSDQLGTAKDPQTHNVYSTTLRQQNNKIALVAKFIY